MQHIPDKDFDQLFKDKFKDAEVEPSADLWKNIAGQIQPKRKTGLPFLWIAAASILVVLTLTIWSSDDEKIQLVAANVEVNVDQPRTQINEVIDNDKTEETQVRNVSAVNLPNDRKKEVRVSETAEKLIPEKNNFIAVQPSASNDHLVIKKPEVEREIVRGTPVVDTEIIYAQANTYQETAETEFVDESTSSKKGIRNMGDLINYVVEKVDKRDKKLIKFDTDDDDNSSIIGLNIGFVKINKRNN